MKFLKKTLSVGLSLVLCASMVAPSFAAVAFDQLYHVGESGELLGHEEEVNGEFVQSYDYYLAGDVTLDKTLVIKDGAQASIDLNGYNLSLNKDQQVNTATGMVTGNEKKGSVISVTGDETTLTVTDKNADADYEHGTGTGTISGGYTQSQYGEGFGGGIKVDGNASLDLKGGTITNNAANNGGGVYVGKGTVTMSGDAKIDGNLAAHNGGGVYLNAELASQTDNQAKFEMTGGTISNNTASGTNAYGKIVGGGGGIGAVLYPESPDPKYVGIKIDGGTITGNKAETDGAGIYVTNGKVSITNGTITGNIAKNILGNGTVQRGGGIYAVGDKTEVTVTNSTISSGNEATRGGGIHAQDGATVKLNGSTTVTGNNATTGGGIFNSKGNVTIGNSNSACKVYANTATNHSDDVYSNGGKLIISATTNNAGVALKEGEEERAVTSWYRDGVNRNGTLIRWGDEYHKYTISGTAGQFPSISCLKAAHNQYFGVSYYLDENATDPYTEFEAEKGFDLPEFNVDTPEKGCHTFDGWNVVDGVDENGKVTGEVKYVAQWTESHTADEAVRENEVSAQVGVAGSYEEVVYCSECGKELSRETHPIDALPAPTPDEPGTTPDEPGTTIEDPDIPLGDEPEVEIDEPEVEITDSAVPLAAGPVTRAQFVDYLWRHEGEPAPVQDSGLFEDVTGEHEYSPAMAWAKSIGIIEAYEDGTFEPDELVTVATVRSILTRFAAYADMVMPELTTLTGGDDEAVLNCDQVLAEFFGE